MIELLDDMLLYHGSYTEVSKIDLEKSQSGLDFGGGFYLTSSIEQARDFIPSAIRKAKRSDWIDHSFKKEDGFVSVFKYHANPNLLIHHFLKADAEWLHYVVCHRGNHFFPELRKKFESTDIICGKIADDRTSFVLNNYVIHAYGKPGDPEADQMAIRLLKSELLADQFCFKTQESIQSLEFIRSISYVDI